MRSDDRAGTTPATPIDVRSGFTRRRVLKASATGLAALLGAGVAGVELIEHGMLPGKTWLDAELGYCTVPQPDLSFVKAGPAYTGGFFSAARERTVGYMISYPPGHDRGDELPLVVYLHGFGGNHRSGVGNLSLVQALAARRAGAGPRPFAFVSVDGGGGYWNSHPGDDPQAMVIDELIPLCRRHGLGHDRIGVMGISMGGYGTLLFTEKYPHIFRAAAAISPAVWTSYEQARSANAGAYASAADFAEDDVITHAEALARTPTRIASGDDDPFHPGVLTLVKALPGNVEVMLGPGCHTSSFFTQQQHPSVTFLSEHL